MSTSGGAEAWDPSPDVVLGRVRLDLAYDGTEFSGWATQPGRRTVQAVVEEALARVTRLPATRLTVAGRTDAGVHATGQVAHADLPGDLDPHLLRRLSGALPADVRVHAVRAVPRAFDARFGALWRSYDYRVSDRSSGVDPLRRRFVLDHRRPLDVQAMAEAADGLLGLRDFAAFCRFRVTGTTIRTVERFAVTAEPVSGEIVCSIRADAFCHSMVRSLVGALLAVGAGRRDAGWPARLLTATARSSEVAVAPAHGLTLTAVGYPPDDELAARLEVTRRARSAYDLASRPRDQQGS